MNIVTIYDLSGNVVRELEFKKVEPWPNKYCRITTTDDKVILTNMPVAAEGAACYLSAREPTLKEIEASEIFNITMILGQPGGRLVRKWENARWFLQSEGVVWFMHGNGMVCVAGPVLIENFRNTCSGSGVG